MAFGIYKSEQGYWVRVLSAVAAGILVLAAAAWAWSQAEAVDLPARAYTLELQAIQGEFAPGDSVELVGLSPDAEATEVTLATTGVIEYAETGATTATLTIDKPETAGEFRIDDVERIRADGDAAIVRASARVEIFPLIYLQAGVTGVIILVGAIAVYWFVALNRRTVDFLINTDGEMRKVNWSSRKEVIGSTQVVIVAAFLIAAFLFIVDIAFQQIFQMVGVLET
jgi:preprotein translocase SecE subunit